MILCLTMFSWNLLGLLESDCQADCLYCLTNIVRALIEYSLKRTVSLIFVTVEWIFYFLQFLVVFELCNIYVFNASVTHTHNRFTAGLECLCHFVVFSVDCYAVLPCVADSYFLQNCAWQFVAVCLVCLSCREFVL